MPVGSPWCTCVMRKVCGLPLTLTRKLALCGFRRALTAEAFGTRVFQLGARQVLFRPAEEKHSDRFSSIETSCVIIEVSETWLNLVRECGQLRTDPFVSINPQMSRLAADLYVQAQQKDAAAPLAIEGLSY